LLNSKGKIMTQDELDKLVKKVRALLALSGNNPSEHEAAAALEKASRLIAEHNLSMSMIEKTPDNLGLLIGSVQG